jgi:hypothetical protein
MKTTRHLFLEDYFNIVRIWGASERRTTGTGSQNPELPLAHIMMVLVLRQVPPTADHLLMLLTGPLCGSGAKLYCSLGLCSVLPWYIHSGGVPTIILWFSYRDQTILMRGVRDKVLGCPNPCCDRCLKPCV